MPWPIRLGPLPRMSTLRPSRGRDLGLLVVGRVVVRRLGGELGGAGVDGLVDRADARARAAAARTCCLGRAPRSAAICWSEKPVRLASRSSVLVERRRAATSSARSSTS